MTAVEIRISCVIPTFNRGPVLCETVTMLLDQSQSPHEIIVVDQSTVIPQEVESQLQRWQMEGVVVWLRAESPNASRARNIGAIAATGDVLLFLDDDIRIGRKFIEAHAINYLNTSIDGVAGQILDGDASVQDGPKPESLDPELDWLCFPKNYGHRCSTTWMASGNVSVRREVYFEVGGMDENYFRGAFREESDFAMRYIRTGRRFQFDPAASLYHLAVPGIGGTRRKHWLGYWFHMYGYWYFVIGNARARTLIPHLKQGIRYFLVNSLTLQRPWRIPVTACVFVGTMVMAFAARLRGRRTLPSPVSVPKSLFVENAAG